MALRLHKDPKSGVWQVRGTVKGIRVRKSTGTTEHSRAEQIRAQTEADIFDGIHGKRYRTYAEAVEGYMDDGGETRFLARMFPHFDGWDLRDITPAEIRKAAKAEYRACAASTINRQGIVPVQAVLNWAHQQGWCGPIRVKRFREATPERRTVDADWLNAFMAEAPDHLAALYLFMFTTGARVSEAVRLRWDDVDMRSLTATLRDTKNGTDHVAHLSAHLAEAMVSLPERPKVFGYATRHSVYGPAQNACKRAGIDYVPPHQAGRHSFATILDGAGQGPATIAKAGNWKSVKLVLDTYTHPDEAGKTAAEIIGRMTRK